MNIRDILGVGDVLLDLRVPDKRRLIEALARRSAAAVGVEENTLVELLGAREALGSTGMGAGIAVPHARLPAVARPFGLFARLRAPVDFDAIDGGRVDLVFLLLLPAEAEGAHLNLLACVARRLRDEDARAALRGARDAGQAYAVLAEGG